MACSCNHLFSCSIFCRWSRCSSSMSVRIFCTVASLHRVFFSSVVSSIFATWPKLYAGIPPGRFCGEKLTGDDPSHTKAETPPPNTCQARRKGCREWAEMSRPHRLNSRSRLTLTLCTQTPECAIGQGLIVESFIAFHKVSTARNDATAVRAVHTPINR